MATTLRRKSREFALQMLFEWDMTRRKPAQVEENFWKQASASDTTQQFADQLFEGAIAHADPPSLKIPQHLVVHLCTIDTAVLSGLVDGQPRG